MQLLEDEIFQNYAKQCKHCLRNTLGHMNMNLLVFHVDITQLNEKTNLVKFQGKR